MVILVARILFLYCIHTQGVLGPLLLHENECSRITKQTAFEDKNPFSTLSLMAEQKLLLLDQSFLIWGRAHLCHEDPPTRKKYKLHKKSRNPEHYCGQSLQLQSNQVKRTPVDFINESSIRKLNPLVVQRMLSFSLKMNKSMFKSKFGF